MSKISCILLCISMFLFPTASIPEDIVKDGETIWFWGDLEVEDFRYRYGYLRNQFTSEMDGFLFVQDHVSNEVVLEYRYDQGYYEEFVYLAVLSDGSFIAVVREHRIIYPSMIVKDTADELLLFSPSFLLQEKIRLDHVQDNYGLVGDVLVSEFEGSYNFWNASLCEISFQSFMDSLHNPIPYQGIAFLDQQNVAILETTQIGNHYVEVDEGSFHFSFIWVVQEIPPLWTDSGWNVHCIEGCQIDGEWHYGLISVSEIGNHLVEYVGVGGYENTYDLTVDADYSGIEDGQVVYDSVQVFSNAQKMELDGNEYLSDWIHEVGEHELILYGTSAYEHRIQFTILSHCVGLTEGETYEDSVTFHVFGHAFLNQMDVSGEITLSEAGEYELIFVDDDGTRRTLSFIVSSTTTPLPITQTEPESTSLLRYGVWIPLVIGGFLILKKKTKKTSTMI